MNDNFREEKAFLDRLTKITEANLNNEQFGVSELAQELGMSRSYIHRRLKAITNQSASHFICTVRLEKAMEMLRQNEATSAEIAYVVGFSSPAYFSHCFHEHYGYSPGEVKKQSNFGAESEINDTLKLADKKKTIGYKKQILAITTVAILLLASYVIYESFISKSITGKFDKSAEKSIIVLPFKNLSSDKDNQYFADGIFEDILNHLSKISVLKVLSRTSSEQFRESTLASIEIARLMNVNYLLQGSVRKQEDNVRVSVQLIDARNDRHLWSENYDRQMADIFVIQSDIAKNVAKQLQTILSPKEVEQINKTYTINKEAYGLYLEGRFYYRLRTKESFEKSIEYYNKALAKDSNYCLAYAGLADTYLTGSWFNYYQKEEGIPKSKAFALKALSIDNNLAEAHASLGGIATYFDFDWETAEKELKLAMKINTGYYRAYKIYSEFMDVIGNSEEARRFINKALELNSSNRDMYWLSYYYYLKGSNYDRALNESVKIYHIDFNEKDYHMRSFNVKLRQNNISGAVEEYKKYLSLVSSEINTEILDSLYTESGKVGVVRFAIEFELQRGVDDYKIIAAYYAIINEKDSALDYLEQAFESGYSNLVRINTDEEFKNFHKEPRFIELLRKMNLADD